MAGAPNMEIEESVWSYYWTHGHGHWSPQYAASRQQQLVYGRRGVSKYVHIGVGKAICLCIKEVKGSDAMLVFRI